jgi:putative ABC transport system permease protein
MLLGTLLMFLELGFYTSVPKGGLLFYEAMRFDLVITSSAYVFEGQPASFPRRRLYQALALPEVERAAPLYHASGSWLSPDIGMVRDVFVIGINPADTIFDVPEIARQRDVLRQPDTVLVDTASRPEFGPLVSGRIVEVEHRKLTIGGVYNLGTGFVGLGVAIASDLNFARMFANQPLSEVNLGLLTLKGGADVNDTAQRLRAVLPADTQVFTRDELFDHETSHWLNRTSTGIIFGFGAVVAIIVGSVILYQTLAGQIIRQLPQFATLRAMGYSDSHLGGIVLSLAMAMSTISYIAAAVAALGVYSIVRRVTLLPVEMTFLRIIFVLAVTWFTSAVTAVLALRLMRRADPVDLF